jgi:dienelactone hydrolase
MRFPAPGAAVLPLCVLISVPFCAAAAPAAVHTEPLPYAAGAVTCRGYLAWDDAVAGRRPGVLVVPEWYGLNDYARSRAQQLAGMGYVALAVDVYGEGRVAKDAQEAGALAGAMKGDPPLLRARIRAALVALRARPQCDPARVAAIGFCFGGTTVLELARDGADVRGVVSFHGGLATPLPARPGAVKAKVLVLHGAADPFEPAAEVAAFQQEMESSGADWQMVFYGHAVHSFSNPASGNDPAKGAAYDEKAATRGWAAMQAFFGELFAPAK